MSRHPGSKTLFGIVCLLILTAWAPTAGTQTVATPSDTNTWQILHAAFHKYGISPYPEFIPGRSAAPAPESVPAAAEPHARSAQHDSAAAAPAAQGVVMQCSTTGECTNLDGQGQHQQEAVLDGSPGSHAVDSLLHSTQLLQQHLAELSPAQTDTAATTATAAADSIPLAQAAVATELAGLQSSLTAEVPQQLPTPAAQQAISIAAAATPTASAATPAASATPATEAAAAAGAAAAGQQQRHHRPPPVRRLLNLAELSDGASVVAANPEARKPERAIDRDIDSFMKNDCDAEKWMIIELSQLGTVETVKLTMKELYSSRVHTFRVLGRSSHPRKDGPDLIPNLSSGAWHLMGSFTAENKRGTQSFSLPQRSRVRYLLLMFDTHYGNEQICAMNWIEVLGVSAAQELEEALALQELEVEHEEQHTEQQQQQQHASRHVQPLPVPQQQEQPGSLKALPGPTEAAGVQQDQLAQHPVQEQLQRQDTQQAVQTAAGGTQAGDSIGLPAAGVGGAAGPANVRSDTAGATGSSSSAGQGGQAAGIQLQQQQQLQHDPSQQQQQGASTQQQDVAEPTRQQQQPAATPNPPSGATAATGGQQQQLDASVLSTSAGSRGSTGDASSGREQTQQQVHTSGDQQQATRQGPTHTGTPQGMQVPQREVPTHSQAANQQGTPTQIPAAILGASSSQAPTGSTPAQGAVPGSTAAAQQPVPSSQQQQQQQQTVEPAVKQEPLPLAGLGQQQQLGIADKSPASAQPGPAAAAAAAVAPGSQSAASLGAVPLPAAPLQSQVQQPHQDRAVQPNGASSNGSNGSVPPPQQQQPGHTGQTGSSSSTSGNGHGNGNGVSAGQQQRETLSSVLDSRGSNKPKQAGNLFDVVKSEMMQLKLDQGKLSKKVDSLTKRSSDFEATAVSLQHQQAALSSQVERLSKKLDALIGTQAAALAQQQQLRKDVAALLAAQKQEQRRGYARSAGRGGPASGRMDGGFSMGSGPEVVIPGGVHIPSQPGSSLDTPRKPLLPPVCARPRLEEPSLLMQSKYQWSVVTALAGTSLLGLWLVLHPKSSTQGFPQVLRLIVCVLALLNGVLAVLLGLWLMVMQSLALHQQQQASLIITDPRVSVPIHRMLSNGSAWDTAAL